MVNQDIAEVDLDLRVTSQDQQGEPHGEAQESVQLKLSCQSDSSGKKRASRLELRNSINEFTDVPLLRSKNTDSMGVKSPQSSKYSRTKYKNITTIEQQEFSSEDLSAEKVSDDKDVDMMTEVSSREI